MSLTEDVWAYKILTHEQWLKTQGQTFVDLGENDKADGFVHLSFKSQVLGTVERYFSNTTELALLRFPIENLGNGLRIETARHNEEFPHYYGDLLVSLSDAHYFIPDDPILRGTFLRGLA